MQCDVILTNDVNLIIIEQYERVDIFENQVIIQR